MKGLYRAMSSKSLNYIDKNTRILEEYRDKCYVNNVLCQRSSEYYGRLKMLISIPLIVLSSIMTVMNSAELNSSSLDNNYMRVVKILNIILNSFTVLLISFNNTFKITEKHNQFRLLSIKYIKLCHVLEDNLVYSIHHISHQTIFELIVEYDNLNETLEYNFPEHVKRAVKKMYLNKKTLPNILNCETDFVHNTESIQHNSLHKSNVHGNARPLTKHFKKNHDFEAIVSKNVSYDYGLENDSFSQFNQKLGALSKDMSEIPDKDSTDIELTSNNVESKELHDKKNKEVVYV